MHHRILVFTLILFFGPNLTGCSRPLVAPIQFPDEVAVDFNGYRAYQHILAQEKIGPRPVGTLAGWEMGNYIAEALRGWGWQVETQPFIFKGVKGRNIIGKAGKGPLIILGAHYDTRPIAELDPILQNRQTPIIGANDGGSGVAVLLEMARVLYLNGLENEVWLAFFDAEDMGFIEGWPFSVGSRVMVNRLPVEPTAVIIVDMVGDSEQSFYFDHNSNRHLQQSIWETATELGYGDFFISELGYTIFDDHIPFIEHGIPAIVIIDFNYPYWHTTADTADKISSDSLERVGQTLIAWLNKETRSG